MKVGIFSFYPVTVRASYEEYRLARTARSLGHTAKIFRVDKSAMVFDDNGPRFTYDGKDFPLYDVVIPRASILSNVDLRIAFLELIQLQGTALVNDYHGISRAKNKLKTLQILNQQGIPVPRTFMIHHLKYLDQAIRSVGGLPVIMKTPFGSYGSGVLIAESKRSIVSALDILWKTSTTSMVLIQQYIRESKGCDIRLFVVGDRVVASMMRQAQKGEFRSNIELGAVGKQVEISSEEYEVAVAATKALGLDVSGVDIVRSKSGPMVLEVNSNPGFQMLEKVTNVDIASEIIQFSVQKAGKKISIAM